MSSLTHVTLGSSDVAKSKLFYDAAFAPLGMKALAEREGAVIYGAERPTVIVRTPANGEPACYGNGTTIGLSAKSRADVDAFHAAGLANGGTCEGAPGPRPFAPNAYGAYLRDPDGNKMCAFTYVAA